MNARERNTTRVTRKKASAFHERGSREKALGEEGRRREGDAAVSGIFYLVVGANVPRPKPRLKIGRYRGELHSYTMRADRQLSEREKNARVIHSSLSSRHRL